MDLIEKGGHPDVLQLLQKHEDYLNSDRPNLAAGQDPQLIVVGCSDSRVAVERILGLNPGEAFVTRNIAGAIQPGTMDDPSLNAVLNYPLNNLNPKAVVILGHTKCGGINGLVSAVLKGAKPEDNDVARWVLPLADMGLADKIRDARAQGATPEQIQQVVEYIMPLMSAKRLLEREITVDGKKQAVGDILRAKGIAIIPAVYSMERREVDIFNPQKLQYEPLKQALAQQKPAEQAPAELLNPQSEITVKNPVVPTAPQPKISTAELAHGVMVGLKEMSGLTAH